MPSASQMARSPSPLRVVGRCKQATFCSFFRAFLAALEVIRYRNY